jgi:Tfp pilus assembly protein FimT
MKPRSAFTIIEMTVVVALASAIFAIALPKASTFIDRIEVRGAVTEIESMFSLARHAAIARGAQVTLDIDAMRGTVSIRSGTGLIRSRGSAPRTAWFWRPIAPASRIRQSVSATVLRIFLLSSRAIVSSIL